MSISVLADGNCGGGSLSLASYSRLRPMCPRPLGEEAGCDCLQLQLWGGTPAVVQLTPNFTNTPATKIAVSFERLIQRDGVGKRCGARPYTARSWPRPPVRRCPRS